MSQVKSPLFSIKAKGTLGNILTSFEHSGRSYMLIKHKRRGLFVGKISGFGRIYFGGSFFGYQGLFSLKTKSQSQPAQRLVFQNAWLAYGLLTTEQKNLLSEEAKNLHMTGANLFMSRYYRR